MPVFISYSHVDRGFVDKLAAHLMKAKTHVWVDRWELNVGDSLLDRIQAAIQGASAILFILSKASVKSEWAKKELNAGLMRELEERRVVVLPVLLEDCPIPPFLREKLYADFRTDFDEGLRAVIAALAKFTAVQGRIEAPQWYTDWALDWNRRDGVIELRLTMIEQAMNRPYCVLNIVTVTGNQRATARYAQFEASGLDWFARVVIMAAVEEAFKGKDLTVFLDDQMPQRRTIPSRKDKHGIGYGVEIETRWIGEDTGMSVLFHLGKQLLEIIQHMRETTRKPDEEEMARVLAIVASPFPR